MSITSERVNFFFTSESILLCKFHSRLCILRNLHGHTVFLSLYSNSWVMACFVTLWYPNEYDNDGIKIVITYCLLILFARERLNDWAPLSKCQNMKTSPVHRTRKKKPTHIFLNGSGKATSIYKSGCKINKPHL